MIRSTNTQSSATDTADVAIIHAAITEMVRPDRTAASEQLFLDNLNLIERLVGRVCSRNHLAASDAEDFASLVKVKMIEDDYAVLRHFKGRSSLATYLAAVIQRAFLDYRNSLWGKWRPSAEAKRAGKVAILVEQLLSRDRHTLEEAHQLLASKHGILLDVAELDRIIALLPARARRQFEVDASLEEMPAAAPAPDQSLDRVERQAVADRVSATMVKLLARLDTRDRLLLTLRFFDGFTVAEIARIVRGNQKELYRRFERVFALLHEGLAQEGLTGVAITEILSDPTVCLGWGVNPPEDDPPTPSSFAGGSPE